MGRMMRQRMVQRPAPSSEANAFPDVADDVPVPALGPVLALFSAYAIGIGRIRWRTAFLVFFLGVNVLPQEA
ncbi:hypothetical protein [Streptomyces marokkonensis]|uniref:hypothetical protein n=1 Tax=Streptomyces marokkonensis TaxID=324855 RepID=UPI003CCB4D7C